MERLFLIEKNLDNEINIYKELLLLAQQQKDALINNDIRLISALTEKQQSALVSVKRLEAEREEALSGIYAEEGLPEESRLRDVIKTAGKPMRGRLETLTGELESMAAKLRRAGELNSMLIDTQLSYTSFCINLITGGDSSPGTYSGSGRMNEGSAAHCRLVDQAI